MTFRVPKIKSCCCFPLACGAVICTIFYVVLQFLILGLAEHKSHHAHSSWEVIPLALKTLADITYASTYIHGVRKKDYTFMLPMIVMVSVALVDLIVHFLTLHVLLGLVYGYPYVLAPDFLMMMVYLPTMLVIYNYYRQLKEESEHPPVNNPSQGNV